jgi:ATP-dependent Clp protease ATP-binding subunit ClpC
MPAMNRMTDRTRKVFRLAMRVARQFGAAAIEPEHLLTVIADEGEGLAACVMQELGVDRHILRQALNAPPMGSAPIPLAEPVLSDATQHLVEQANNECRILNHNYIGTEHLLIAITRLESGICRDVLASLNLAPRTIRNEVYSVLGLFERIE